MYLPDGRALRMIVIPFSLGGVLFAFEDMTSSLALERSFNTLSAVQRAMLNNLSEAIAVFGQDGRLKLYNPAYLKLLEMDEQYASNSPHISDILESKKYLFHVQDSNWINVKNDLISSLYEREFQRTILKMSNDMVIYRNVAPLPDGATLITYMNNSDLVKCQASLNEKKMIINDLFLCQHQFIMSVDKKFHFLHSKLQQEFKKSNIDNINNIDQVFKEIEAQQNEMLSVSEVNLSSINNNSSVIDVNQLIDQSIKKIQNNINVEDIIFSFSDNYHCSMIANHSRINMILDKIFQYVIELTDKAANLHVEVSNDDQKLIVTLIITNSKIIQNALEQKFLLIQSILEVYSEKLLLFCNQDGFKLVLYLSQFQVNQVLEHNAQ